jgi:hypothetical protein
MDEADSRAMNTSRTLMLDCPVCRSDLAETLGVAGGGDNQPEAAVVMCCEECETVYLTPPPPSTSSARPASGRKRLAASHELRRVAPGLAADARVTRIDGPEDLEQAGTFDLILIDHELENARDPGEMLRRAARLLTPHGQIVLIAANARSSCFATFGGRHWSGYRRAGARQQFTAQGIARLCTASGLRLSRLSTKFAASAWLDSAKFALKDWGAGRAFIAVLTGPWLVPALLACLIESISVLRGRGAALVARLVPA